MCTHTHTHFAHLHTDDYTHYLVSENDINATASNMETLCREHRHLDRTGWDDLHPMLFIFINCFF